MTALLISNDPELRHQLKAYCSTRLPVMALAAPDDAAQAAARPAPTLVMVDARGMDGRDDGTLAQLASQFPDAAMLLLAQSPTQELLMRAMRAGVREVVSLPLVRDTFEAALERLTSKAQPAGCHGKVLAFISCKGGSGATFIAANLGYALAQAGRKVLLIDLNQQFGDAALYLTEQKPAMTLADVCGQIGRVDPAFLEASLLRIGPDYGVLAAPEDADQAGRVQPEHIETILRIARQCFDLVLLDIGRQIDSVAIRALDNTDAIYPVLQLALPDIRDGCRLLDIFRSLGYRRDDIRLVVNRYEKGGRLRLADLESALGAEVVHTVPNDYVAVTDSVNQGVPLLRQSDHSAAACSLLALAGQVLGRPAGRQGTGLARLLGRIFH